VLPIAAKGKENLVLDPHSILDLVFARQDMVNLGLSCCDLRSWPDQSSCGQIAEFEIQSGLQLRIPTAAAAGCRIQFSLRLNSPPRCPSLVGFALSVVSEPFLSIVRLEFLASFDFYVFTAKQTQHGTHQRLMSYQSNYHLVARC
jgi:hypothetical protein